jgi:Tol biopolymer transport system component
MTTTTTTFTHGVRLRRLLRRAVFVALVAAAICATVTPRAGATAPGKNGLIAFNAITADGTNQIFTVRPNGKELRQITHLPGDALVPDWSPDGTQLAFEVDGADGAFVETIGADGSGRTNLTPDVACCSGQPSFTPDGRRIVFERFDLDTLDDGIWSMTSDGGDVRHLLSPFPAGVGGATDPNVSPDGQTISFVGFDGSLFGPPPLFEPAQSLDTTSIDGGGITQLLPPSDDLAIKQDWAPDGSTILAGVNANFFLPDQPANIVTIRPDGSGLRRLTNFTEVGVNAFAGSYSPDGRYIVFRFEDHGLYSLMRMNADGSHPKTIFGPSSFRPRNIDWGPRTDDGDGDR